MGGWAVWVVLGFGGHWEFLHCNWLLVIGNWFMVHSPKGFPLRFKVHSPKGFPLRFKVHFPKGFPLRFKVNCLGLLGWLGLIGT